MTRILETKAATRLLKATFGSKGVTLKQTEALDLLAKLQGYEAWSHLQSSLKRKPLASKVAPPVSSVIKTFSFTELIKEEFGNKGVPDYPHRDWAYEVADGDTNASYYDWLASTVACKSEIEVEDVQFLNPLIQVQDARGWPCFWNVEQNLTTRDGDLNDAYLETKPGLALLLVMETALKELQDLMTGENTFIVRKDKKFGLLFEIEYCSTQSEETDGVIDGVTYMPHDVVLSALRAGLLELERQYPEVQFSIPSEEEVVNGRPAVWAYVGKTVASTMTAAARQELAVKLAQL